MTHILDKILERKRAEVRLLHSYGAAELCHEQAAAAPPPRGFAQALRQKIQDTGTAVIAEIKKASPSKGLIREDFDPVWLAQRYAAGGAACLSVLTDREFFKGAPEYLEAARNACELPVLRKDFIIDELQVCEARALGADCILLIAAALNDQQLGELSARALDMGMDVLAEVHSAAELERVLKMDARCLIGINNRDLRSFETRLEVSIELRKQVPAGRLLISESGIHTPADIQRLQQADIHTYLIGESLMRQTDPGSALGNLLA